MRHLTHTDRRNPPTPFRALLTPVALLWGLLTPLLARAQVSALPSIVTNTAGPTLPGSFPSPSSLTITCPSSSGACEFANLLIYFVERSRLVVAGVAILITVIAALTLVGSHNEETHTKAKRALSWGIVGIFVIFTADRIVAFLYGNFGLALSTSFAPGTIPTITTSIAPAGAPLATGLFRAEALGVIGWIEMVIAIVAVVLLVLNALRILISFGKQDVIQKSYKGFIAIALGLLLLALDQVLIQVFDLNTVALTGTTVTGGVPTTAPLFTEIFGLVRFVLTFVAIVLIAIAVYAGMLMILHLGNEEAVTRAKQILFNAVIGLVIVLVAFAIVSTIILGI